MVKENIRYFILKTNNFLPFRNLYKTIYLLGLKVFIFYLKRIPGVQTIYLRESLLSGNWMPGDSDIDVTVIVKNMETEEEIRFLIRFWQKMHLIAEIFPFIFEKDVLLLTVSEFNQENFRLGYSRYTFGTPISKWKLLAGRELRKFRGEDKPVHDVPISYYLNNWYTELFTNFFSQPYGSKAFLRFYYKVSIRVLKVMQAYEVGEIANRDLINELILLRKRGYWSDKLSEVIPRYLYHLTNLVDSFYHSLLKRSTLEGQRTLKMLHCGQEKPLSPHIQGILDRLLEKLSSKEEYLMCVLAISSTGIEEYNVYFVLKENFQFDKFRLLVNTVKKEMPKIAKLKIFPYITTKNIFIGELQFLAGYSATDYFYIRSQGKVIFGRDIRKKLKRPPDWLINKKFKEMAFWIKYVNTKRLFQSQTKDIEAWEFYDLLEQRLRAEKGMITQTPSQTMREYTKHYSHEEQTKLFTDFYNNENLYLFTKYILEKLGH